MTFFRRPFRSRALRQDFEGFTVVRCLRRSDVVGDDDAEPDSSDDSDSDRGKEARDEEEFDPLGEAVISDLELNSALRTSPKAIARGNERDKAVVIVASILALGRGRSDLAPWRVSVRGRELRTGIESGEKRGFFTFQKEPRRPLSLSFLSHAFQYLLTRPFFLLAARITDRYLGNATRLDAQRMPMACKSGIDFLGPKRGPEDRLCCHMG